MVISDERSRQTPSQGIFKQCSFCQQLWRNRDSFLKDPEIEIIGYQANIKKPEKGFFLFNHRSSDCGTTLSIGVSSFVDFYEGTVYHSNLHGSDGCSELCLHQSVLSECPAECECAYVREVLQILKEKYNVLHPEKEISDG